MNEELDQIVEESEKASEEASTETTIELATVSGVHNDGISIILDGNDVATSKHYKSNTGVRFQTGDRVKVVKESGSYIVEYPVGNPNTNLDIPTGGTADHVLTKNTNDDFDYSWKEIPNPLPTGGAIKQVLMKNTATNYDIKWGSVSILDLLPSGTVGQFLQKTSTSTGVAWADPTVTQLKNGVYTVTLSNTTLTPSNASTISFGTQLYPFKDIYVNGNIALGTNSYNAKLGFFGTTPIAKQTLSNSATVAQVITALKNYGLFT